jgi:regulation of enolase protein 1 (concanavalin A-like superfamily)
MRKLLAGRMKSLLEGLPMPERFRRSLRSGHWYWYTLYYMGTGIVLAAVLVTALAAAHSVQAQPQVPMVSAAASCTELAEVDRTATNGSSWGQTLLPGHGLPGGWFGVDVCANGFNGVNGGSSSVSCDRVPDNWNRTGCEPGKPTSDGYGWTFQCPELVVRFSAWAFGDNPADWGRSGWGNAPDLWTPANHPADFVMYPNGSTPAPVPGDILVWGSLDSRGHPWPAGPDGAHGGHTAVVAAVTDGYVVTAEQNVKWGSQDHPTDRLALTKVGNQWILSGSQTSVTQLPTYRWPSTMGDSRATYGWLHSVRNTWHFPSQSRAVSVPATGKRTTVPQQPSGGLPSLATSTVITGNGELADLVWTTSDFFARLTSGDVPHAAVRSLGAPPDTLLIPGERPATVTLSDSSRLSYAVGLNGDLYALDLVPTTLGVLWTDLGHPSATLLDGSVSASTFAGGLGVAAVGTDGNLWWRTGPPSQAGVWQEIGKPDGTSLATGFTLAAVPGEGTPLILALGANGRLYERVWIDAQYAADGAVEIPAAWSNWTPLDLQPSGVAFSGALVAATESAKPHDYIGSWPDTPLDICVLDTSGRLWWLRTEAQQTGWQISQVAGTAKLSALLAGIVVDGATDGAASQPAVQLLQLYATSVGQSNEVSLRVPDHLPALTTDGSWTSLPPLPAVAIAQSSAAVVSLSQGTSVLVLPGGDQVFVGGAAAGVSLLRPEAATSPSWTSAGSNATAPAFTDTLMARSVDNRWAVVGTSTKLAPSTRGMQLLPGSGGAVTMLQTALSGSFKLSVYVRLTASTVGQAGLVLYTDDADWLSLLVNQAGRVSLCMEVWQRTAACDSLLIPKSSVANGVWLQIERQGPEFMGAVSLDAVTWRLVGVWTPLHSLVVNGGSATATAGSDPVSSLAFTTWGIMSVGSFNESSAPGFRDFSVAQGASAHSAANTTTG